MHDLDLLVDQDVRQLERRVGDGVLDDLVGELVAGPIEGVRLEPLAQFGRQGGQVGELADRPGELVVGLGQDLLAELLEVDREMGRLAPERLFLIVVREDDVEFAGLALCLPDEVLLEARDEPLLAEDQRHPLRRAAGERHSVARAHHGDHRVVALLGASILHVLQAALTVAQLVDHLLDHRLVDRLELRLEAEVLVVAELDVRPNLHGGLEDDRLALFALGDLDFGRRQGREVLLDDCLAEGIVDELFEGFVEIAVGPRNRLEHHSGRLAGSEAGNAGLTRQAATAWSMARLRRSGGSSNSSASRELGSGVLVVCIVGRL